MNARTWVWKEFREQGPLVALVVGLSLAVAGGLAYWALVAENNQLVYSRQLPLILGVLLGGAGLTASLLGANAVAGERESGTLPFLEHLAGGRAAVWRAKVLFAVLGTLAAVTLTFGAMLFTRPEWDFFAWSLALVATLLGGTLFFSSFARSTLAACGMTVGSLLALAFSSAVAIGWFEFGQGANQTRTFVLFWTAAWCVPALLGAIAGRRIYCGDELVDRPQSAGTVPRRRWWPATQSWPRVLWLVWRQGSWTLVAVPVVAVLLASMAGRANDGRASERLAEVRLIYRPLLLIVLGIFVGVGAFSGDNTNEARRLWADARLPAGRMWLAKLLFWLAWAVAIAAVSARWLLREYQFEAAGFLVWWTRAFAIDAAALLTGVAVSTLVAMCVRKSAAAFTLSLLLAVSATAVWLPSLLMGDFRAWVALAPAIALLIAARLLVWPWVCGTLGARETRWRLLAGALAALALTAGAFAYRAGSISPLPASAQAQFPETWTWSSETFSSVTNVESRFYNWSPTGSSPSVALAGPRSALAFEPFFRHPAPLKSELWREWMQFAPLSPPRDRAAPNDDADPGSGGGGGKGGAGSDQAAIGLGVPFVVVKPRASLDDHFGPEVAERIAAWSTMPPSVLRAAIQPTSGDAGSQMFTRWLLLRDLELIERGRSAEALELLLGTLALTRFQRIEAHLADYLFAVDAERVSLAFFERWLQREVENGPHAELLDKAAAGLSRHASQLPPPRSVLDGRWVRSTQALRDARHTAHPQGFAAIWDLAWLTPWESQRRQRITEWTFDGWYAAIDPSAGPPPASVLDVILDERWLPSRDFLATGQSPGAFVGVANENLSSLMFWLQIRGEFHSAGVLKEVARDSLARVRAAQLQVASVEYHAARGRYPDTLAELAPECLPSLDAFPEFAISRVDGLDRPAILERRARPAIGPSRSWIGDAAPEHVQERARTRQWSIYDFVFPLPEWPNEK